MLRILSTSEKVTKLRTATCKNMAYRALVHRYADRTSLPRHNLPDALGRTRFSTHSFIVSS
jgi:hypothetical protein